MRGWRGGLICGATLYVSAAAQQGLGQWTLLGGRIDFLVCALSVLALFTSRTGGAAVGFAAGWLYGSLDGANMWQYVATRTVVAFLISWLAEAGMERNLFSAMLVGFGGIALCQLGMMFLAPPAAIPAFLGDTIRTAVYNGVFAMLFYAVLNRILGPRP